MKFDFKPILLGALLGGAALTTVAQVQPDPAAMQQAPRPQGVRSSAESDGGQPQRDQAGRRGRAEDSDARMERHADRVQVRVAQRLAALKVKLRLTPSQEGAWDTFARAMQPTSEQLQRMLSQRAQLKTLSTPERIDRLRASRSERDAAMDGRFDATKAFYAQLAPEQQRTFDALSMHRGGQSGSVHDRHHRGPQDAMGHGERHGG